MIGKLEARVKKLATPRVDPGRLVVWFKRNGDPEPEHGPDDVLIVVVYEGDEPAISAG